MSKLAYASLSGAGALGASGLGMYHLYPRESKPEVQTKEEVTVEVKHLGSKLTANGFKILTDASENSQHWATIKAEYDKIKSDPMKSFNPTNQEVTIQELQALCKDRLGQDREDLYSTVKRWCVVPTTVSNHLSSLKLTPLSTEGETDKGSWETLSTEYSNTETDGKISEVIVPHSSEWQKLQKGCKDISGKQNYEDGFDAALYSSMRWCVKR